MKTKIFFILLVINQLFFSQAIDPTFLTGTGFNSYVSESVVQPDGKIIVVGNFTNYNGVSVNRIVRLNIDGNLDNSFNIGFGPDAFVRKIILLPNGKILLAGSFDYFNNIKTTGLVKLNNDGSIDNTFNLLNFQQGNLPSRYLTSISVQNDGKILIMGEFTGVNSVITHGVTRIMDNGTLDSNFVLDSKINPWYNFEIKSLSGNKVLLNGIYLTNDVTNFTGLYQLNENGSIDTNFHLPSTTVSVFTSAIQNDGKIIITGEFENIDGYLKNGIARLNPDGSLDQSFNQNGDGLDIANGILSKIFVNDIDGDIILGGKIPKYNNIITNNFVILNSNGTLKNSFDPSTFNFNNIVTNIIKDSNDKLLIVGDFTNFTGDKNRIVRLISEKLNLSENNINKITLLQNPVKDQLEIISNESIKEIIITDITGRIIMSTKNIVQRSNNIYTINVENLPAGIFVCKLKPNNGQIKSVKFVKK